MIHIQRHGVNWNVDKRASWGCGLAATAKVMLKPGSTVGNVTDGAQILRASIILRSAERHRFRHEYVRRAGTYELFLCT